MTETALKVQHDQEQDASERADNRPISELRAEIIAKYEQRIPLAYRDRYRRAISGKSRTAAVRAFCLECAGWAPKEVRHCTAQGCPLYPYRLKG